MIATMPPNRIRLDSPTATRRGIGATPAQAVCKRDQRRRQEQGGKAEQQNTGQPPNKEGEDHHAKNAEQGRAQGVGTDLL
jgi:hypothetical protein